MTTDSEPDELPVDLPPSLRLQALEAELESEMEALEDDGEKIDDLRGFSGEIPT